ncbi:MAG: hypothetical protein MI924_29265 [Chloroflexales bacterium]|nr:hypothetical protein [Chloroflexales bacterium]
MRRTIAASTACGMLIWSQVCGRILLHWEAQVGEAGLCVDAPPKGAALARPALQSAAPDSRPKSLIRKFRANPLPLKAPVCFKAWADMLAHLALAIQVHLTGKHRILDQQLPIISPQPFEGELFLVRRCINHAVNRFVVLTADQGWLI